MVKPIWIVAGVLGAIALVVLGGLVSAVGTYNAFVREQEAVDAQGNIVDVQYQRAFRLVPQLTNLTQQYMQNERAVIENATALRSGLAPAANGSFEAKDNYLSELVTFVALVGNRVEAYPELRSNELFQQTMDEVVNTENKIATEKVRYNDRVRDYNAHLRQCCIPLLVAGFAGFGPKTYIGFQGELGQAAPPEGFQY